MKLPLFLLAIWATVQGFGQSKQAVYYDEAGQQVSREEFITSKDYRKNIDLYFEDDSRVFAILVTRQKFGQLDRDTFSKLKSHLSMLSEKPLDTTQNIVINYLSAVPAKTRRRSRWSIFDLDYPGELHKIANIRQFWIYDPARDDLEPFYPKRLKWLPDRDRFIEDLFFPYQVNNGNYVLVKPDGTYFYYLGEHSKNQILEHALKFF